MPVKPGRVVLLDYRVKVATGQVAGGEVVGQHLEPGRGVQPPRARRSHDPLLGERQPRGVREELGDRRPGRLGVGQVQPERVRQS